VLVEKFDYLNRYQDSLSPLKYYVNDYVYWLPDKIGVREVDRLDAMDPCL